MTGSNHVFTGTATASDPRFLDSQISLDLDLLPRHKLSPSICRKQNTRLVVPMATNGEESKELWRHSSPHTTQIHDFIKTVNKEHLLSLDSYNDLWEWSIAEPAKFWEQVWKYTAIVAHQPYSRVSISLIVMMTLVSLHEAGFGGGANQTPGLEFRAASLSTTQILRRKQAELC